MHSYERSGKIGKSKPESKKKAQKQAVAIALNKARKSGAKIPKKGHSKVARTLAPHIKDYVRRALKNGGVSGAKNDTHHHVINILGKDSLQGQYARAGKILNRVNGNGKPMLKAATTVANEMDQIQKDLRKHERDDIAEGKKTNKYLNKLLKIEEKEHK